MFTISSKKAVAGLALASAAALVLSSCASAPEESETTDSSAPAANADYKACMVSDAGGFDDNSFNQSSYEGLQSAGESLGIQINAAESADGNDYAPNINSLVDEGCNIIVTVGFLLEQATEDAATANPDTKFVLIDSTMSDEEFNPVMLDNVKSVVYNTQEAAYLAGYASAAATESGTIGTFGGMQIPTVTIFMDGFADGIDAYNEAHDADVELLGWDKEAQSGSFTGDFEDQSKGKTLAEGFISQGADIIYPVAGPVGHGAIAAATDAGDVGIVWVDADGYLTVPDSSAVFLTSVIKRMGEAVETIIADDVAGTWSNEHYVGTLENDGVAIADFNDWADRVPAEVQEEIEALREQIISGELIVETEAAF